MYKAIVFDLDDTLYMEIDYVKSGFKAIAEEYNNEELYDVLLDLFKENKNDVYQRAGFSEKECLNIIQIYRDHQPKIECSQETKYVLNSLKQRGYKLGIITDGRSNGQWNKIIALGLNKIFDCIIVTDELGGVKYRKPCSKAFEIMKEKLGVDYNEMVYVGDNPAKDFYIGHIYPITTVRLMNNGFSSNNAYYESVKESYRINNLNELLSVF